MAARQDESGTAEADRLPIVPVSPTRERGVWPRALLGGGDVAGGRGRGEAVREGVGVKCRR